MHACLQVANISGVAVIAGQTVTLELASFGSSLSSPVKSLADVQSLVRRIAHPVGGLQILQGKRQLGEPFIEPFML
jgi:hypothetical protein